MEGGRTKHGKTNTSVLPSHRAIHGIGGTTLARKKLAERRKSANKRHNGNEVINMEPILDSQDVDLRNRSTPDVSGKPMNGMTYASISPATDADLEDLTIKDLDMLKELKCPMAKKKELRARIIADQGKAGSKSSWSSSRNVKWRRFKEDTTDLMRQAQLWRSSIHEIEGRFGNGIRSYFAFLRWLFILNLYIFFMIFIFVVVPTIAFESLKNSGIVSTIPSSTNVSAECAYDPYNPNSINSFPQYIIWWFTGQGFMENTLLFYGYYDNSASIVQTVGIYFYYNIPLAYLLVAFFYFFLSLVLLVRRAAVGLKESLVSDEDRFYTYCNKVFAGWDYCITDDHAGELKNSSLKYELQTDLEEERIRERQTNRTRNEKIILYTKRFFINLLVILILVAALVAIFYAAQYALQNGTTFNDNFILDLIVTYLTSIVITVANFIAPIIFGILIAFEDYSPAFTIQFTLIRTVFLRLASVVFLYVVVYLQINCQQYDIVDTTLRENCTFCEGVQCWETYLGQEMYKLTLLDFFIVIAVTLFVEFPRKLIVEHCKCGLATWWGQQEFSIPDNVLDIVYAQTVGWIGAFYAPLLPAIVVIKFFIFFYLKKLTLIYNCRPATRPYRASRSGTFFFIILFVGFVVSAFPVVIGIALLSPSEDCGPFRGTNTMFSAITTSIQTLPDWLQQVFWFVGSSGFAAIVIVLLCLVLYYFVALSSAHKKMIGLLKDQLTLEGKDKQFLLSRVNKLNDRLQGPAERNKKKTKPTKRNAQGEENPSYSRESTNSTLPGQPEDFSD